MKNFKVLFVALAVSAFVFGACGEKCITCTYTVAGETISEETCGAKEVRDAAEVAAELAATLSGTTADCK